MKIGIVGAGLAVRDLHLPALRTLGLLDSVSHVVTSSRQTATAQASKLHELGAVKCKPSSLEEALTSDVDIVLVAVPISRTEAIAEAVLSAGKALLAEKPIATTSKAALRLLKLAQKNRTPILAGENFRLQRHFARMRELAQSGIIGDVRLIVWNDLHYTPDSGKYAATAWRIEGGYPGGYLLDGGSHIVAGFRELSPREIRSVHALATATQPYLSGQDDTLLINVTYGDGLIGHLSLGYGVYDPEARHPKIYGASGTLALMQEGITHVTASGSTLLEPRDSDAGFVGEWRLLTEAAFGDRSAQDECFRLTRESINDLVLIESAIRSSERGSPIKLEYTS